MLLESRRNDSQEDDVGAVGLHDRCDRGLAQTKQVKGGTSTSGVTKTLIQETLDAWSTMDTNKIAPFYSEAPENIFFDVAPMQFKGWQEWAKGAQNEFSDYKSFKLSLTSEPVIHNESHWAWGTYLWHLDAVHKDGKTDILDGRDTAIWHKQGNRWLKCMSMSVSRCRCLPNSPNVACLWFEALS